MNFLTENKKDNERNFNIFNIHHQTQVMAREKIHSFLKAIL